MIDVIKEGVNTALSKCRERFSNRKWNCSPLNWVQVLSDERLLRKGSSLLTSTSDIASPLFISCFANISACMKTTAFPKK